jgi:hypothetical protein
MDSDKDEMSGSVEMLDDNCCDLALHQIPYIGDWLV